MINDLENLYGTYEANLTKPTDKEFSNGYFLNTHGSNYNKGGIILYGQEANGWDKDFNTYAVGLIDIIENQRKTPFCKIVKIVWENNGLINNIAKFSYKDNNKNLPVSPNDDFWGKMYKPFKFKDTEKTIYQHELDILKPKKVILLCGPGRVNAITKAFNDEDNDNAFKEKLITPKLDKDNCVCCFSHNNIEFLYGLHPSAFMKKEIRTEYNKRIDKFINSN